MWTCALKLGQPLFPIRRVATTPISSGWVLCVRARLITGIFAGLGGGSAFFLPPLPRLKEAAVTLLPDERVLFEFETNLLSLTTHRVRMHYGDRMNGGVRSIMLEEVSCCGMERQSKPRYRSSAVSL